MAAFNDESHRSPAVWAHLESSLDVYQQEHEELFADPETDDDVRLHEAMNALRAHAFDLLTTGRLPPDLGERLSSFQPGASLEGKVLELFLYDLVQHRIEFDVAWDVVARLRNVDRRVQIATLAFVLLLRSDASETAIKYFRKAAALFLAGYDAEVAVMCGAVLEAALATRIGDSLKAARIKPAFPRTGDYSIKQRMDHEAKNPFLSDDHRKMFWEVITWRNDAVHVQPDLAPLPEKPVLFTANLLSVILPRAVPS
jgi:hypothetical protein